MGPPAAALGCGVAGQQPMMVNQNSRPMTNQQRMMEQHMMMSQQQQMLGLQQPMMVLQQQQPMVRPMVVYGHQGLQGWPGNQ